MRTPIPATQLGKLSMRQQIRVLKEKVIDQNQKIRFLIDSQGLWNEGKYTFPDGGTFYREAIN